MLSDGYGDDDSFFVEEMIRSKERLLHIQAAERTSDPNTFEDLINEGRIALWEVSQKRPDAPPAYYHAASGMRIKEVATRGLFFGQKGTQGRAKDPLRRRERDSLDDPDFYEVVVAAEVLEAVLLAYHDGEILQAISGLPARQREYVILRFWGGLTNPEIAARQGLSTQTMERTWRESIRPALTEKLGHLRSLL